MAREKKLATLRFASVPEPHLAHFYWLSFWFCFCDDGNASARSYRELSGTPRVRGKFTSGAFA